MALALRAAIALSLTSFAARGADLTAHWVHDDPPGSVWTDLAEWSTPLYPNNGAGGLTFDAVIDAGGTDYVVTLNTDIALQRLTVGAKEATLLDPGHTLTLNTELRVFSLDTYEREARVRIVDGGVVTTPSATIAVGPFGEQTGGTVVVEGEGSRLTVAGGLFIGPMDGTGAFGEGHLEIRNGAVVSAPGTLVVGDRSFLLLNHGTLLAGKVLVSGDVGFEINHLEGLEPMIDAGFVQLAGAVAFFFNMPETPAGTYQFIADGVDPTWITQTLIVGIDPGRFTVDYEIGQFTIAPLVPGDINGDLVVDFADILGLLLAWGSCGPLCPPSCAADFNGDCAVGLADLLILLANWG